ncbi:MAG: Fic family protein [Gammaproteobacteria bacterium]|nr:Fic family protein [Gammaproteobacteria bacterium]
MTTPSEKLAKSLEALRNLQEQGNIAIQARNLSRTHRERLIKNGFLQEVMKGWYIPSSGDKTPGESTAWYTSYWVFCSTYLNKRFGHNWCLSPEQSLSLHAGNWTVPKQLFVRSPKGNNKITPLPHHTSFFDARYAMPNKSDIKILENLRVFSLPSSLVTCSSKFFLQNPTDTRTALSLIRDASEVLDLLLAKGHTTIAGRLAGAFRSIGRTRIADEIIKTMSSAGYETREINPFEDTPPINLLSREHSPYVNRLKIMWQEMRLEVLKYFPKIPKHPTNTQLYLKQVKDIYLTDAYNSLSIEGYRVNHNLIQHVRAGKWDPDSNENDKKHIDALAARGYWQAFNSVEKSIGKVLRGVNPGNVFDDDHRDWYREMFAAYVTAGILKPTDLAGYRRNPVYIRHSMHVPPNVNALCDLMLTLGDLLREETDAAVRVVLGHFFFVYIHPYSDGNGRMGRFLMNVMLAAGGYPWLVIPIEERKKYMTTLEEASTHQNIVPFCKFLAELIKQGRN